jgi:hypothetical protein
MAIFAIITKSMNLVRITIDDSKKAAIKLLIDCPDCQQLGSRLASIERIHADRLHVAWTHVADPLKL